MSDLIPEGWKLLKFGDIANIHKGLTYATSNYSTREYGYPFITLKCIKKNGGFSEIGLKYYDGQYKSQHIVIEGDVVFANTDLTRDGDVVGSPILVPEIKNEKPSLISMDLSKVLPKEGMDKGFIYYWLNSSLVKRYMINFSAGSTVLHLNTDSVPSIPALVPPISEQQKIAAILTSVDEVIEKTQAQIDKLKDLKSGMMQELLTKGVGIKQGDKYAPHTEFKDSPVGRIPKSWDYSLLDKVAKRGSGHTPDKQKPEYWNGGIKWISLSDSSKLDNLHIHDSSKKISQLGIDNSSATLHPEGSVIMARDAGIGKSAIITSAMAVSQHFMAWICGEKLNNYFLYYLLQLWKPTFENIAMGSTIKTIGLPYFKKLQIPVPPIEEQKIIADSLISVENKIFALQQKYTALSNTKKALMQDLLTGKVRVKVDNDSVV